MANSVSENSVKGVTSSADHGPTYSERVRNLTVFNRANLIQDSGIHERVIQDPMQAQVIHGSTIDEQRHVRRCLFLPELERRR